MGKNKLEEGPKNIKGNDESDSEIEDETRYFHGIEIPNALVSYRKNDFFDSTVPDVINKLKELGYDVRTLTFDKETTTDEIKEELTKNEALLKDCALKLLDNTVTEQFKDLRRQTKDEFARIDVPRGDDEQWFNKSLDEIYNEVIADLAFSSAGLDVEKLEDLNEERDYEHLGKILSEILKQVKEKPDNAYVYDEMVDSHIHLKTPDGEKITQEETLEAVISWLKEGGLNASKFNNNKTTPNDWVVADRHTRGVDWEVKPAKVFPLPIPDFVSKLFKEKLIDINPTDEEIIPKIEKDYNFENLFKEWGERGYYVTEEQLNKMNEELENEEKEK